MSELSNQDEDASTVGWDAISGALERLYPGKKSWHWGTLLGFRIGGQDPLDGISAYLHDDGLSTPHWHFISFGMSELYAKEWDNKEFSGWGFEFTFRLKREPAESEPPQWPLGLLQNLARYVFQSGNFFAPGHYFPLNGPIALERETAIHAAIFTEDSELKKIDTPNGSLQFLQLVGATIDELAAARRWNAEKILELMRLANPLLVTDLSRQTILSDAAIVRAADEGTTRDGSSTGSLFVRELEWVQSSEHPHGKSLTITVGASGVADIQALLRGRTLFERDFHLFGPNIAVTFSTAERFHWERKDIDKNMGVGLPLTVARALAAELQPKRGDYQVLGAPGFTFRVVPSRIMDSTGKTVVEVIG